MTLKKFTELGLGFFFFSPYFRVRFASLVTENSFHGVKVMEKLFALELSVGK